MVNIYLIMVQSWLLWILFGWVHIAMLQEADIFASTVEMEPLIKIEKEFPSLVKKYIEAERERLKKIKEIGLNLNFSKYKNYSKDADTFIGNPINVFHLIKRFSLDMKPLINLMNTTNTSVFTEGITKNGVKVRFPNDNDFKGVALGLDRLRQTYNLQISSLAKGELTPDVKSKLLLSAMDCFQIGNAVFNKKQYAKSIPWYEAALKLLDEEKVKTVRKNRILDFLSYAKFKTGEISEAIKLTEEFLKHEPTHKSQLFNLQYYRKNKETLEKSYKEEFNEWDIVLSTYEELCRNEQQLDHERAAKLKCHYSRKSPYLTLQPAKIEVIHLDPWISIVHDVIRDKEIDVLQKIAIPKLKRAKVGDYEEDKKKGIVDFRISKVGWLADTDNKYVNSLTKRLEAITGMTAQPNASDMLQMNNYGIGGHYEPHVDHSDNLTNSTTDVLKGNRIATVLIYLSDVLAGGATVFPRLNIGVFPIKGSAVFWYNIYTTGEGDSLTLHAACPVLAGRKWVANKWIYQYEQMFRRPCLKNKTDIYQKY